MSQKYAIYDTNGNISGFDLDIDDKITGLSITDEEWQDCLRNPGRRKVDLTTFKIIECEILLTKEQQIDKINNEYVVKVEKLLKAKSLAESLGNPTTLVLQQIAATLAEQKEKVAAVLNS